MYEQRSAKATGQYYEQLVIDRLNHHGIPAIAGGAIKAYCDVMAWGCVMIEVKSSGRKPKGHYQFGFTPNQQERGLLAHLVVLVLGDLETCHILPANHIAFYDYDAEYFKQRELVLKLKTAVVYNPMRKSRTGLHSTLTPEIMQEHLDNWSLIEDYRLRVSQEIKTNYQA